MKKYAFRNRIKNWNPKCFIPLKYDPENLLKGYETLMLSLIVLRFYVKNAKHDFELDSSYCDANDVYTSQAIYVGNRPSKWNLFFYNLFGQSELSEEKRRVCDVVFQTVYKSIHNNKKRTPLSISYAQTILDLCRSKHLLTISCRLGLCVSYDEIERIDTSIVQRLIALTGPNRVPVPNYLDNETIIHGVTDNFDQKDIKGGSHDSILMLFQNSSKGRYGEVPICRRTEPMNTRLRKRPTVLPCQTLINIKRGHKRGSLPPNYVTGLHSIDKSDNVSNYDVWTFARYIAKVNAYVDLPSYSAFNSILKSKNPAQNCIHSNSSISNYGFRVGLYGYDKLPGCSKRKKP